MWVIQIIVGSFWLYMGVALLFQEHMCWTSVENIEWFKRRFGNSSTDKWERFCRDTGIISLATGCLLFLTLPFGVGVLGVILFIPPLAIFL